MFGYRNAICPERLCAVLLSCRHLMKYKTITVTIAYYENWALYFFFQNQRSLSRPYLKSALFVNYGYINYLVPCGPNQTVIGTISIHLPQCSAFLSEEQKEQCCTFLVTQRNRKPRRTRATRGPRNAPVVRMQPARHICAEFAYVMVVRGSHGLSFLPRNSNWKSFNHRKCKRCAFSIWTFL